MDLQQWNIPTEGERIRVNHDLTLSVPDQPIIPFIEGDGIGAEITLAMRRTVDRVVAHCYGDTRRIHWLELFIGEKARHYCDGEWFPTETLDALKEFVVAIKGPLLSPCGGGFHALNAALRQELGLYLYQTPVRWLPGLHSPVYRPEHIDIVLMRECTEDSATGLEWPAGSPQAERVVRLLQGEFGVTKLRFPDQSAIGIRPVSREACRRLVYRALQLAQQQNRTSLTLVHSAGQCKHTEGAWQRWALEVLQQEFGAESGAEPGEWRVAIGSEHRPLRVMFCPMERAIRQLLLSPDEHSIVVSLNQNGLYLQELLVTQAGGNGIAPRANLGDRVALFEATHGPAVGLAGRNQANPGALILSAEMMLRHLGWSKAADHLLRGVKGAIQSGQVTRDLMPLMPGSVLIGCQEFADQIARQACTLEPESQA